MKDSARLATPTTAGRFTPPGRAIPEGMEAPGWYAPTERGLEAAIREKLAELRRRDAVAAKKK